ncbi:hypothetical protein PAXRUDRAFT_832908 [Paxillus rubicundulus Ve08.2h10]|uniref:Uncharacterized protein n=1 Tax=Paxillus rubicundulus Ve08.2h10 TaxID=930991 RepID=A0A0D0D076_9AGAM|nr:hypothetical protein PAXRUDRAFT_832908 [Paxillus rubicundulus Ve08.2h10]
MSSTSSAAPASTSLPASLDLPPHLSAQKYFFVCTLTVLAWDTLVLTPRSYKLGRSKNWPALKALYYFLQVWVLADFVVTGAMFFSTSVTQANDCRRFWPYEPICTAILLFAASSIHVIRVSAIYSHASATRTTLLALLFVQAVVTAICCGFYRSVGLRDGQGCIAGPLNNMSWVGIYWLAPTILYATSFSLALMKSLGTLEAKPLTYWRLMLRDNLNLYGAVLLVNLVNVLFYFIMTPTDSADPIKTIVSSMAGVLTATMSMRIVLGVKGPLENGGSFTASGSAVPSSGISGSLTAPGVGVARGGGARTFTLGDIHVQSMNVERGTKEEGPWDLDKNSVEAVGGDAKAVLPIGGDGDSDRIASRVGVQITVDQEVEYDRPLRRK